MPKLQASALLLQALSDNAAVLSGALLKVYVNQTTTPVTTYTTDALTTAQAWPLVANSAGRFASAYVPAGVYRVRVETSAGVLVWESDDNEAGAAEYNAFAYNIGLSALTSDLGVRTYRATIPGDHAGVKHSHFNIETTAGGSFGGDPNSADYGMTINIAKDDWASGSAASGEIDGITIYARQGGPQGLSVGDPDRSDVSGILANVQTFGDCGFACLMEGTTSAIETSSPYAITQSMQTQMGVISPNTTSGDVSYGYTAVAKVGAHNHAFYAGVVSGATWTNILTAQCAGYADGGFRITRGATANDASEIIHRGTGALLISAVEAGQIQFATTNAVRAVFTAGGTFQPPTNKASNLGAASVRWSELFVGKVHADGLVTYADNAAATSGGLVAGDFYKTSAGAVMVVY